MVPPKSEQNLSTLASSVKIFSINKLSLLGAHYIHESPILDAYNSNNELYNIMFWSFCMCVWHCKTLSLYIFQNCAPKFESMLPCSTQTYFWINSTSSYFIFFKDIRFKSQFTGTTAYEIKKSRLELSNLFSFMTYYLH